MPDNNVAETARSPSSRPCLSVRSHGDDVSGVRAHFKIPQTDRWTRDCFFLDFFFLFMYVSTPSFTPPAICSMLFFPLLAFALCPLPSNLCFFSGVNIRVEQRMSRRQMMSWADGSLTETDCSPAVRSSI